MTKQTLRRAKAKARKFLTKVSDLEKNEIFKESPRFPYVLGSKESGDVRRSSMDLTRALADLRR